jgi:hypothetical protein
MSLPACGVGQEARSVRLVIEPRPHFVGQPLRLEVQATADNVPPAIRPPSGDGFELVSIGTYSEPVSSDAIGDQRRETFRFRFRFRLIPLRAGTIRVGPFRVGDDGTTAPFELRPSPVPRPVPGNFSGAVGSIEATSGTDHAVVRLGQSFEYWVRLDGLGALGPIRLSAPDLGSVARVKALPPERSADPPSRTYRFVVTATTAGAVRVPPIVLRWFDPSRPGYATTIVPPVRVDVRPAEPLDLSRLELAQPTLANASQERRTSTVPRPQRRIPVRLCIVAGFAVLLVARLWRRLRPVISRSGPGSSPGRSYKGP